MSFFKKKPVMRFTYDPEREEPVVRKSICTGEMTVGFLDRTTGKFRDYLMVDAEGLEEFRRQAGLDQIRTIY